MKKTFKTNGQKFELSSSDFPEKIEKRPGGWILIETKTASGLTKKEKVFSVRGQKRFGFSYQGRLWSGEVVSSTVGSTVSGGGESDLTAQFPGKIRKILCQKDQKVEQGASLFLIEAMKMEFSVKAPFSGKVSKILVSEGQQISPGDRFLDLTPDAESN